MKYFGFIWFLLLGHQSLSQATEPVVLQNNLPEMKADKDFKKKYNQALRRLRRVYPLALEAKALLLEFDGDLAEMERKREKKKYGKKATKTLKEEFTYDIKDLYIEEGILLMKLIHRETGMTVSQVISKYRGNLQATVYEGMGKIWDQNLDIQYDPKGEDWIYEVVINDIIHKRVSFDWEIKPMNKELYKQGMKDYRENKRKLRKVQRHGERAGEKSKP